MASADYLGVTIGGDSNDDQDDDPLTSVSDLLLLASEVADQQKKQNLSGAPGGGKTSAGVDAGAEGGDEAGGGEAPERCQVCDLPIETKRQASDGSLSVCQACKKFFQRNRNRQESSLRCITGTNNCLIGKASAETIATGVVWRKVCPRCRLAKCIAIGMQNTYRDIWPSLAQMPPIRSPEMRECSAAEHALKQTAIATAELASAFRTLPLKVNDKTWTGEQECWRDTMQHFESITRNVSGFVKAIPGYNDLPVKDRCALFGNSLLPISLAEANRVHPTPGCINAGNAENIFKFFPEYRYVRKEADHIWALLSSWNPSLTEFSCLLAVLFYRSFYITRNTEGSLHGSNGNIGAIADLELAIRALLMQQCSGDVAAFNSRIQHLLHVAENLRSTVIRRQAASAEVAARCPHLFQMNALYSAVQREYYKNNAPSPPPPLETSNTGSTASSGVGSTNSSTISGRPSTASMSTTDSAASSSTMKPPQYAPKPSPLSSGDYSNSSSRPGANNASSYPTPPGGNSSQTTTPGSTPVSTPASGSTPVSSPLMSRAPLGTPRHPFPPTPNSSLSSSSASSASSPPPPPPSQRPGSNQRP